jgi:hypothetical protein
MKQPQGGSILALCTVYRDIGTRTSTVQGFRDSVKGPLSVLRTPTAVFVAQMYDSKTRNPSLRYSSSICFMYRQRCAISYFHYL